MKKTDSNIFLTIFCTVFILTFIIKIIFSLILNHISRDIDSIIAFCFTFSIVYSFISFDRYTEYSTKIMLKEITKNDIISKVQQIMKKKHWSMVKNNSNQIIFKSSVFITIWREYLVVTINENSLELVGSKCFVKELIKK